MNADLTFQVRVVESYKAPYPDPIQANAGDEVAIDLSKKTDIPGWIWCTNHASKNGWVPTVYIEVNGDRGKMLYDYNAIELTIHVGEILTVHKTESGFHWATNQNNRQGWIPIANVEPIGG